MIYILGWLVCSIITWLRIYQYQKQISLTDVIIVLLLAPILVIVASCQFIDQTNNIILIKKK